MKFLTIEEMLSEANKVRHDDGAYGVNACRNEIRGKNYEKLFREFYIKSNVDFFFNKNMLLACYEFIKMPIENHVETMYNGMLVEECERFNYKGDPNRIDQEVFLLGALTMEKVKKLCEIQHDLKIYSNHFEEIRLGRKNFEIRKNDRNFNIGDDFILREFDGTITTERYLIGKITDIFDISDVFGEGYVAFNFELYKGATL